MALRLTQPLTEMSTRNSSWGKRQPVHRADNLTTFMCQLSWNLGASTSWNPQGLCRPIQGLLYLTLEKYHYVINSSLLLFQNCPQHFISPLVYNDLSVHPLKVDRCWVRTPFMSVVGPTKCTFVFSLLWFNSLYMFRALVDWYRGYGATTPCAPKPWAGRPFVRRHLVPSVISRGAVCQATPETSVSEERKWARNVQII
jgi:hypothetical protein